MRVDGRWMGLQNLARRNDLGATVTRVGGWSALYDMGPNGWRSLGWSSRRIAAIEQTRPTTTRGRTVFHGDDSYPKALASLPGAPPLLFVEGTVPDRGVAIVGSRRATHYGASVAEDLGYLLAQRSTTVVSGLARGIDGCAHRGAVRAGSTVAVLAHGLAHTAPRQHEGLRRQILARGGGVVTTWPDEVGPRPWQFPLRNRWIAGLSSAVVVVEASVTSGSMHTVQAALELGREVWAVPGPIGRESSAGCNRLIADGAHPLIDVEDFVARCAGAAPPRERWLSALYAGESLERVASVRGGSVVELLRVLQRMEAEGQLVRGPGRRYSPSR